MNSTEILCPKPPYPGLTNPTSKQFSLFVTIIYPVFLLVAIGIFLFFRDSSVFLRKRPIDLIIICAIASMIPWSCTALYDYLGSDRYPCAVFGLLFYLGSPLFIAPTILKIARYSNERARIRLEMELKNLRKSTMLTEYEQTINGEASLRTFLAHLRVVLTPRRSSQEERILSSKFSRTRWFLVFWLLPTVYPYLIAYFIRLGTNPVWYNGCYGCDADTVDIIILLVIYFIATSSGVLTNSFNIKQRDALRITRECLLIWVWSFIISGFGLILYLVDPVSYFVNGILNWRDSLLFGCAVGIYIQTIHQVIYSKILKRNLLVSPHINRLDRFIDCMNDRQLREALRSHLNRELSGEALNFIEYVDSYKIEFDNFEETRTHEKLANYIFHQFIMRKSPEEINISSDCREELIKKKMENIEFTKEIFDRAYEEIRSNLLVDGFARFLEIQVVQEKRRKSEKQKSKSIANMMQKDDMN